MSCKTQEIDKIIALSSGGDDYMTKPFMPGELIARIKAHLRRRNNYSMDPTELREHIYQFDDLKIDFDTYELFIGNKEVSLTTIDLKFSRCSLKIPERFSPQSRYLKRFGKPNAWTMTRKPSWSILVIFVKK